MSTADTHIIEKCIAGDKAAWGQLYKQWAPYCCGIIRRYGLAEDRVADLLQEIFIQVFVHLKKYDPERAEFKWWLRKLAVNKILMALRAEKSRTSSKVVNMDEAIDFNSKELSILDRLSYNDLLGLIKTMPDSYRLVFNLNVLDGYSHKEVASALSISEQNSRIRLNRAKIWLRDKLSTTKTLVYGQSS